MPNHRLHVTHSIRHSIIEHVMEHIYISNEKRKKNQKKKIDMMVWMGDVG